jgi:hypothetical protein
MSSTPHTKSPLDWKSDPPSTSFRGLSAAFTAAWEAGVFRGRLHDELTAAEYLALVTPYLPAQSDTPAPSPVGARPDLKALAKTLGAVRIDDKHYFNNNKR